jgi:phage-related protein
VRGVEVVLFKDDRGRVPILEWMDALKPKARAKLIARLGVLRELGYQILANRTMAAYLRDDIYEIRFVGEGVQYRALFFFRGQGLCIVSHGISKDTAEVPLEEIERAIDSKRKFDANPDLHTHSELPAE